jgi:hypothetical protein
MLKKTLIGCLAFYPLAAFSAERDDNSTYSTENPEYQAPKTPELYDSSKPKGMPITFPSAATLGGFVSFGQSKSAESDENPKVAWFAGASFNYLKGTSTWSRVEFGADLFRGSVGHSAATIPVNLGFVAHAGYGYSLGGDLFGTLQIGAGLANVGYEGEFNGKDVELSGSEAATVLQFGWHMALPVGSNFSFTAGVDITKMDFTVGDVVVQDGSKLKVDLDKRESLTIPSLQLGFRAAL